MDLAQAGSLIRNRPLFSRTLDGRLLLLAGQTVSGETRMRLLMLAPRP
jgi:hypothetical protein